MAGEKRTQKGVIIELIKIVQEQRGGERQKVHRKQAPIDNVTVAGGIFYNSVLFSVCVSVVSVYFSSWDSSSIRFTASFLPSSFNFLRL